MKTLLSTFTTNRFAGVFTGILAITLLESSSVTIIMVIAVVSSRVLTFVQSLVVVLGSNIGTAPYLPAVHRFDANSRAQSSPWSPGRLHIYHGFEVHVVPTVACSMTRNSAIQEWTRHASTLRAADGSRDKRHSLGCDQRCIGRLVGRFPHELAELRRVHKLHIIRRCAAYDLSTAGNAVKYVYEATCREKRITTIAALYKVL